MSLRIHFSATDLTRVTLATGPDPCWELLLSLHALQGPSEDPLFWRWRNQVPLTNGLRALFRIAPSIGYSPDFLTPAESADGLEAGLEALLGTPRSRLREESDQVTGGPATWVRRLTGSDSGPLRELTAALAGYFRGAVQPHWSHVEQRVHSDRLDRARLLLGEGVDGLLSGLHPSLVWNQPVLELRGHHVRGDLRLDGRGLRLVPSFFCHGAPTLLADPALPPVLVYPIVHDQAWLDTSAGPHQDADEAALAALLGPTRAQILKAAALGCTTTELGNHAGISPASASYHASILREAGLITTERAGTAVRHTLTPLGEDLLTRQRALSVA